MFQFTRPAWGATTRRGRGQQNGCFNSRAPRGARPVPYRPPWSCGRFNSRAPRGARHLITSHKNRPIAVSIHAPRVGRDGSPATSPRIRLGFQFTRPAWGATSRTRRRMTRSRRFNSRAPRGARQTPIVLPARSCGFNSRAPRGARPFHVSFLSVSQGFNSRAPRGARPSSASAPPEVRSVSIHAPRVGRDGTHVGIMQKVAHVSIHAPRVGRDKNAAERAERLACFNSRAPRGARLREPTSLDRSRGFQFTRPAWGATNATKKSTDRRWVSIHAPRVGRDAVKKIGNRTVDCCFNSRAPRGARPVDLDGCIDVCRFNSRAPRGARRPARCPAPCSQSFNSRAPRGARHQRGVPELLCEVSIHAPRVGRDGVETGVSRWRIVSIHAPRVGRDRGCTKGTLGA